MSRVYRLVVHDAVGLLDGVGPELLPATRTTDAAELRQMLRAATDAGGRACVVAATGPGDDDLHRELNAFATSTGSLFVPVRVDPAGGVRAGPWVRGRSTPCWQCFSGDGRSGLADLLRLDELHGVSAADVLGAGSDVVVPELPHGHGRIAADLATVLRASLQRRSARSVWGRILSYPEGTAGSGVRTWRAVKDPTCACCGESTGDGRLGLAALFHANTALRDYAAPADNLGPGWRPGEEPEPISAPDGDAPAPGAHRLPAVAEVRTRSFEETVLARRSARTFAPGPLTETELAHLLFFAAGVSRWARTRAGERVGLRVAPSGGALNPLDLYVRAAAVAGVPRGTYRYRPGAHALEAVAGLGDLARLSLNPPSLGAAPVVFLIAATPARTKAKYLERGYRLVLLEAGHVAQNLHLAATALGLRSCCVAGFLDEEARQSVGVPEAAGTDVVYLVAVGR